MNLIPLISGGIAIALAIGIGIYWIIDAIIYAEKRCDDDSW